MTVLLTRSIVLFEVIEVRCSQLQPCSIRVGEIEMLQGSISRFRLNVKLCDLVKGLNVDLVASFERP